VKECTVGTSTLRPELHAAVRASDCMKCSNLKIQLNSAIIPRWCSHSH